MEIPFQSQREKMCSHEIATDSFRAISARGLGGAPEASPATKIFYNFHIGRGKLEVRKLTGLDPARLPAVDRAWLARFQSAEDEPQMHEAVRIIVELLPKPPDRLNDDINLLPALSNRAVFNRLSGLDLATGEFPAMSHRRGLQPLRDEEFS